MTKFDPILNIKTFINPDHFDFESVNCYQCGSNESTFFLKGEEDLTGKDGEFQYVKCNNCELVYQNPRISISGIKEFYDTEYIAHRKKKNWGILTPLYEHAMSKHDREKEKLVRSYMRIDKNTRVLDVGCAVGTFLLHLNKKYECQISGVDFKENLEYPDFEKIDFHEGLFYEQDLPKQSFDLITMWHFFEHDYDPNQTLKYAKSLLKPGGLLIIEVPRLDSLTFKLFKSKWPGIQAPQHTALYDKNNLVNILHKHNYKIDHYLPYGAFPAYFYIFTGAYFRTLGKGLNLDKIVFPYFLGQFLLSPILWFQKKLNLSMQTVVCSKS